MADTISEFEKFSQLVHASTLNSVDKASVIKTISGYYHYGQRNFSYSAAGTVSEVSPNCRATFARTFDHADWRDGEDLVQAGGIHGFNVRFNALKADLDKIRTDLEQVFQCQADLRHSVAVALVEVRDQLNAINKDIADCCNNKIDTITVPEPPQRWAEIPPRWIATRPKVGVIDPGDPMPDALDLLGDKVWVNATDPNEAVIRGIKGKRIDTAKINGKDMDVWQTDYGLMMSETRGGSAKPSYTPDALRDATLLSRYVEENKAKIADELPGPFDKQTFLDKFGEETVESGATISSILGAEQPDTRFSNVGALLNAAIDHHVETLADSGLSDAAIVGAVGVQVDVATPDIPINALKDADTATIKSLNTAGFDTIGKLAAADPAKLADALGGKAGAAGELSGLSRALVRLGRVR